MATATLKALRQAYPEAHITWAVGSWSRPAVEHHDLLDAVLDTGPAALPVKTAGGFWRFVRQLRGGPFRSGGVAGALAADEPGGAVRPAFRSGPGWTVPGAVSATPFARRIDPADVRPEAEIYLDVARALGIDTAGCYANVPVDESQWPPLAEHLARRRASTRRDYIVINPTGGRNPGMTMDSKRWPPEYFAALADGWRRAGAPESCCWAGQMTR